MCTDVNSNMPYYLIFIALYALCSQEEIEPIQHSELTDLKIIGQGGFGLVYKAKHGRFGTVVYKELDAKKLGDQYVGLLT